MKGLLIALAVLTLGAPVAAASVPQVLVAHRGFGGSAQVKYRVPENSVKAWDLAIVQAERDFIIDIDAQWTSDGVMVAMHDRSLSRTTNGSGNIDQRTWSYVKGLWLELPVDRDGNGNDDNTTSRVPSISTALDFLQPRHVNGVPVKVTIEMKGDKWTQSRVNALKVKLASRGMFTNRVNVHAFKTAYLDYAKKAGFPNIGYVAPSAGPLPSATTVKKTSTSILVRHNLLTQAKIDSYNAAGIKVWAWTVDTQSEYVAMSQLNGLYAWVTDDLIEAQEAIRQLDPDPVA